MATNCPKPIEVTVAFVAGANWDLVHLRTTVRAGPQTRLRSLSSVTGNSLKLGICASRPLGLLSTRVSSPVQNPQMHQNRLRARALIAMMIYTFGRVGAVIKMRMEDYYTQGRRGWVRLQEKGGKRHEMPCNHNLEAYIDAYISAAGLAGDLKGYLFRSIRGKTRVLTSN